MIAMSSPPQAGDEHQACQQEHCPTRPALGRGVHQLIQAADRGETALADLIAKLGAEAETARELAYRLYVVSERRKRTTEAGWYNGLVKSWQEAARLAATARAEKPVQATMFGEG